MRGGENQKQGFGAVFGSVFFKEKGRAAAWEHKIKTTGGDPWFRPSSPKDKSGGSGSGRKTRGKGGGRRSLEKDGFRVRFFLYFF